MNADDFRDYMLAFLFLRYLSDTHDQAARKELKRDYPDAVGNGGRTSPDSVVKESFTTAADLSAPGLCN